MERSKSNGWLIAVEGIDAAGKRTQSLLLSAWLNHMQLDCKLMSFPDYTTRIGREIRAFLSGKHEYPDELKHILFAANRWEKLEEIKNTLDTGGTLIVNRYTESNLAYGLANGLELDWLISLEKGLPRTDLVILLDAPPTDVRLRRVNAQDSYEADDRLQEAARSAYRRLARKFGWKIVDATDGVKEISGSIRTIISNRLSLGQEEK
jgi:dTMP kinase